MPFTETAIFTFIRRRLADHVIYQSRFHQRLVGGSVPSRARTRSPVIINGVDLERYTPDGLHERPSQHTRLLVVEGNLTGAQNTGLTNAVNLAEALSRKFRIELVIAGNVDARKKNKLKAQNAFRLRFMDMVPREQIPWLMRSSHLLFSAEVNPPCPNSVIEALSCGLPVIGFDTGSLSEIIQDDAGRLAPYGANPWKLERPDIPALAEAAMEVIDDQTRFRQAARARAEFRLRCG